MERKPKFKSLVGITGFKARPSLSAEQQLIDEIDTIDLHHGPYSTSTPYTELEAVGCVLTDSIRAALNKLGFDQFEEQEGGFIARRTPTASS